MKGLSNFNQTENSIEKAIAAAVAQEIERIVGEEANKAAETVRNRVNRLSLDVAARVMSYASFERDGQTLTIKIDAKDWDKTFSQ